MINYREKYETLKKNSKKIQTLNSILMLLEWDQETKMPEKVGDFRAEQIELLSFIIHKEKTSANYEQSLNAVVDFKTHKIKATDFDEREKSCITTLYNDFLKNKKIYQKRLHWVLRNGKLQRKKNLFYFSSPFLVKSWN